MGGGGHWYLIVALLVIVLIFFGPGKLPEVGSAVGKSIREFRKSFGSTDEEKAPKITAGEEGGTTSPAKPTTEAPTGQGPQPS
jgi:sec-independent protein translocase protein TatA